MSMVKDLAAFVVKSKYEDLSDEARRQAKIRVLDALGCAIGALDGEPIKAVREQIEDFGGSPQCTLIGGGRTSPDRAALYNGYLAKGETCHPNDNLARCLLRVNIQNAAERLIDRSGCCVSSSMPIE